MNDPPAAEQDAHAASDPPLNPVIDGDHPDAAVMAGKAALRRVLMARRSALPAADRMAAAQDAADRPWPDRLRRAVVPGVVVSGYSPLKNEISPLPLLRRFADAGAGLALPVVIGRGKPLVMRAWTFGAPLDAGVWGIGQPPAAAPEVFPDILIVPLLAFDRAGNRIGYGAGYYDMTLARLRAMKPVIAVGIAFAAQEVGAVPVTPRDARLDLVVTERETIDCGSGDCRT